MKTVTDGDGVHHTVYVVSEDATRIGIVTRCGVSLVKAAPLLCAVSNDPPTCLTCLGGETLEEKVFREFNEKFPAIKKHMLHLSKIRGSK